MCSTETILGKIVEKIVDTLFQSVGRHVGFILHYKQNLKNLDDEVNNLQKQRSSVQGKVDEAKHCGEAINNNVLGWLNDADETRQGVDNLRDEKTVKENMLCFNFSCPNFISRYRLSKQAEEEAVHVKHVTEEGGKIENGTISHPREAPLELEFPYSRDYEGFHSRDKVIKGIVEALKDPEVNMIGVYGTRGVGKTTMVTKVGELVKKDGTFDEVVMAVVSKDANVIKIQGQLADRLILTLRGETEWGRAKGLWNRLDNGMKNLILLDDVRQELNLKDIGIPITYGNKNCKVVLTSRNRDVWKNMDVKDFKIEILSEEESWALFKKTVGNYVDAHKLHEIACAVCKECQGLPGAIIALGATLKDKHMDAWQDELDNRQNSMLNKIGGVNSKVFTSLKWSSDRLDSDVAKSYIDCNLVKKSSYINAAFRSSRTNEAYLFMKDEYLRLNYAPGTNNDRVLNGPLRISEGYPSLKNTTFAELGIDCAFGSHHGDEAFIFSGNLCARINYAPGTTNDKIIHGPMTIIGMFPFFKGTVFESGVDSAFESTVHDEAYLFKGNQYAFINYNDPYLVAIRHIIEGFVSLKGTIFESGIEAAFASHHTNEAYLFKGDSYACINFAPYATNDYTTVKQIVSFWPSLKEILPRKIEDAKSYINCNLVKKSRYINAAFRSSRTNEAYLFMKDEYLRLDYAPGTNNDRVLNGPLCISKGFPSLKNTTFAELGIDCAFGSHHGDEAFIFSRNLCARINYAPGTTNDKIIHGPMTIIGMFPFFKGKVFESGVDSAFESTVHDEAYLFKGNQYAHINYNDLHLIAIHHIIEGFVSLKGTIFESGIEAAFASHRTNEAYLFKGDSYACINFASHTTNDNTTVKQIISFWPSLNEILPRKIEDAKSYINCNLVKKSSYINAAFRSSRTNEAYLFMKNEYLRLDYAPGMNNDKVLNGPLCISKGFPSLKNTTFAEVGIDCAFGSHHGDEAFIFSGNLCARINYAPGTTNDKIIHGPMTIIGMFPFFKGMVFESGVDSAFESTVHDEAYLFKGNLYALINYNDPHLIAIRHITEGFVSLKDTIFESGIEAAFASHRTNEAYLFKGDSYACTNFAPHTTNDYTTVKQIVSFWPSLKEILPRKIEVINPKV